MGAGNTADGGGHEVAQKVLAGMTMSLDSGKRLFGAALRPDLSFEQAGVIESPFATHLRYRPAPKRRNGGGNA
jgi:hypothetical protein